jgi:hypothetical protein
MFNFIKTYIINSFCIVDVGQAIVKLMVINVESYTLTQMDLGFDPKLFGTLRTL